MEKYEWLFHIWIVLTLFGVLIASIEYGCAKFVIYMLIACLVYCVFFKKTKLAKYIIRFSIIASRTIGYVIWILIVISLLVGFIRLLL